MLLKLHVLSFVVTENTLIPILIYNFHYSSTSSMAQVIVFRRLLKLHFAIRLQRNLSLQLMQHNRK